MVRTDLAGAALVTSECQNGVIGAGSALPALAEAAARTVVPNGARLCAAARAAGVPVVHCVAGRRPDDRGSNRNARLFGAMLKSPVRLDLGTPATEVVEEFGVAAGDFVLSRIHGLNPMAGTDLDPILRNLGVRTLVVVGVSVNVAVTNLVMDAVNLGYQVVVPRDAVAGVAGGLRRRRPRQHAVAARRGRDDGGHRHQLGQSGVTLLFAPPALYRCPSGGGWVQCGACGSDNPSTNRFCGECGSGLVPTCPRCGADAQPAQKFCGQCAASLIGAPPPPVSVPAQAAATSENRYVSVLFVDLVGFTTLSEGRDAEDVRELLSRYFEVARTVIGRYGGTVEKFIGDAVMAVWGVPTAREDDAERAVRAALDVVEAVGALGAEVGLSLQARGGVVTGGVTAWTAPGEGIVAGDRVNTASRVQSLAAAGQVLVDDTTRRTTSVAISYLDAGEHLVKGKTEPLHLWRAERVVAGVGGSQRMDGLEARFIGRDADLRLVKELFHACIDRGSARLVHVVGVAGVGKSRLRWELDKYIDGLADYVWYHSGRCLSYGDGVAYSALAEMLRQRFNIAEDDPTEVAADRLTGGLAKFVADESEREYLLPRLGVLLGVVDASLGREELFAGWRLFFERLTDSVPVVLAFEDLQWADSGLLDFIDYLLDWASGAPIFVVTFARPEVAESRPGWPAGRRNATSLYLEPLGVTDMAELLDDLVTDLPVALRQRIVERSEGIPLYAVETVRSLIDRDVVVPKDGAYRVVGDVGDLDVPTTLTSLLAARLDGLPADERALVKDLAVLGGSFSRATVSAVCELEDATLDRLLTALVRKEFLSVRSDKLSPDRGQYGFAQSMLRTVAYDMLTKHERKAGHLRVAGHLRAVFDNDGEDVAEAVAAHYRDALLAAEDDPDAADIRRDALAAYDQAGRKAAGVGAPETAMALYTTAADLADDMDERLALRERAVEMGLTCGRHQETLDLCTGLRADYDALGRRWDWARLAVTAARGQLRLGRGQDAVATMEAALPVLDDGTYTPEYAEAVGWHAAFLGFAGRSAEAEPYTERALVAAQALGPSREMCRALVTRSICLVKLDRFEEALMHVDAAAAMARRNGWPDQVEHALITGTDLAMTSDLPDAVERSEESVAFAQHRGSRYTETVAASNLLYVLLFTGDWTRVERLVAELFDSAGPDRPQGVYLHTRLAVLAAWRGDRPTAHAELDACAGMRASDQVEDVVVLAAIEAAIANAEGRFADALRRGSDVVDALHVEIGLRHESLRVAWVEAVTAAISLGETSTAETLLGHVSQAPPGFLPPYLTAQVTRFTALLAAGRGDVDEAEHSFTVAEAQLAELGYPYWLARTRLDHAEWLGRSGQDEPAAALAASAAVAFADLGAESWAARARALAPQPVTS